MERLKLKLQVLVLKEKKPSKSGLSFIFAHV